MGYHPRQHQSRRPEERPVAMKQTSQRKVAIARAKKLTDEIKREKAKMLEDANIRHKVALAYEASSEARQKREIEHLIATYDENDPVYIALRKHHWMDKIFTRINKTLKSQDADHLEDDAATMIQQIQEQAKTQGPEAIALAFDCLSLGVKLGRVRDTREVVEDVLRKKAKAEQKAKAEAERKRLERHAKNTGPKWREDERRFYDAKILDLIRAGKSNRKIADEIPLWAERNSNVNEYRIPGYSVLQVWAAALREKKKRRKRAH